MPLCLLPVAAAPGCACMLSAGVPSIDTRTGQSQHGAEQDAPEPYSSTERSRTKQHCQDNLRDPIWLSKRLLEACNHAIPHQPRSTGHEEVGN